MCLIDARVPLIFEIRWHLDLISKFKIAKDINECMDGRVRCEPNAMCRNTLGSFRCVCKIGFIGNGLFCEGIQPNQNNICKFKTKLGLINMYRFE